MTPGPQIAHYRITSKLGEGGMGAVYRATDTKLNRDVAIKVLPAALAADSQYMARFEREAQVLASLNHPNIAAVYGIEAGAIVMELVEGAEPKGPLPLDEVVPIARQIALGLEAAHERGIVHRDLKPANIKLTPTGIVKILDFGLAKSTAETASAATAASPTLSPTLSLAMTQAGMILGTAAYMSPEQARGKPVDKRADIWAFGVVLYELLTGKMLFGGGETVSDTLASVMRDAPDLAQLPAGTPPHVRRLLERCLRKDAATRLRDIGEARVALDEPAAPAPVASRIPARRAWLPWAAAALFAAAFLLLWLRNTPPSSLAYRYTVDVMGGLVASPDGRWILSYRGATVRVRPHNGVDWRTLPGTDSQSYPFWSPDSSTIGFFSDGRLRSVSVEGGDLRNLAPAPDALGGTWRGGAKDGAILFAAGGRLHAFDLAAARLTDLPVQIPAGFHPESPAFLPEGDRFLYLLASDSGAALYRSALGAPAGPPERFLATEHQVDFARHPRTGDWHLFFTQGSSNLNGIALMTAPINPRTGEMKRPAVKILSDLSLVGGTSLVNFSASGSGTILWRKASASLPVWRLRWFDLNGNVLSTVGEPGTYMGVTLSPDETRVAAVQGYPASDVWIYNLQRGTGTRLSTEPGSKTSAVWSADSRSVFYALATEAGTSVIRRSVEDGEREVIYHDDRELSPQACTPDGRYLLLVARAATTQGTAFRLDLAAGTKNLETLGGAAEQLSALNIRLTPDGRWVLLTGADSRILPFPFSATAPANPQRFSVARAPFLNPDGKTVYGMNAGGTGIIAHALLPAADGRGIRLGEPSFLFPIQTSTKGRENVASISRDNKRILAISADPSEELKMQVLTDWTTLLPASR